MDEVRMEERTQEKNDEEGEVTEENKEEKKEWRVSRSFSVEETSRATNCLLKSHRSSSMAQLPRTTRTETLRKRRPVLRKNASVLSFQGVVSTAATFLFKYDTFTSPVVCMSLVGSADIWMGCENGSILIWDKKSLQLTRTIQYHKSAVTCLVPFGDSVWVGSLDGSISIWQQDGMKSFGILKMRSSVRCIQIIRQTAWVGCEKKLQCWCALTRKKLFSIKTKSGVHSLLHLERNSELWVGLGSGSINIYSDIGEYKTTVFGHERKVNIMKECGDNIWSGSSDNTICVWVTMNYERTKQIDVQAPVLTLESEKSSIWAVSHTGKLNIWDGITLEMVYEVSRRVQQGIIHIKILPVIDNGKVVGKNIWVTSSDKIVSVWKILASKAFKEIH